MKIFLSWSGEISKQIASVLKEILEECFFDKVTTFMSTTDIAFGTDGISSIYDALKQSDICIACITPMNLNSPWIAFETGLVVGNSSEKKRIIPLIFGDVDKNKFSKHPLYHYQHAEASLDVFKQIFNDIIKQIQCDDIIKFSKRVEKVLNAFYNRIEIIVEQIPGDGSLKSSGFIEFLKNKYSFGASLKGEVVEFENSFETPALYEAILRYVDKRLYIFGRKNTKLFSNVNRSFFNDLNRRFYNGFDFKCLFVSPYSPNVNFSQNDPNFYDHLLDRIQSAKYMLNNNLLFEKTCRFYNDIRNTAIIIADDVVIFSPLTFNSKGVPNPLTHSDFFVTDSKSEIGIKYIRNFNSVWNNSQEFTLISSFMSEC